MNIIQLGDIVNHNQQTNIMIVDNKQAKNILFIGSCRIYAFLNYFLNDDFFGKKYNYLCILVYIDKMVELSKTCITNEPIKKLLNNTTILVSEYITNYNYFNTSNETEYNIFKLNNNFEHTIILPNFHNPKIYVKDIIYHGDDNIKNIFKKYLTNEILLDEFIQIIKQINETEINRYCNLIQKSFMPELETFVRSNVYKIRIAHTINHPSNILLIEMYRLIMNKIFKRNLYENVITNNFEFLSSDGYSTKLTYYDKIGLNIDFDETIYNKEQSDNYLLSTELFYKG
jgi:hypothetical protein